MNDKKSFLDQNTLTAVVIIGVFFVAWQFYLKKKYPTYYENQAKTAESQSAGAELGTTPGAMGTEQQGTTKGLKTAEQEPLRRGEITGALPVKEQLIEYENGHWSFSVSNKGMGLRDITLKNYKDREQNPRTLGVNEYPLPFSTNLIGRRTPIDFEIKKVQDNQIFGTAQLGPMLIKKTILIDSKNYILDTRVEVENAQPDFAGLSTYIAKEAEATEDTPFFLPSFDRQEFYYSFNGDDSERVLYQRQQEEEIIQSFSKVNVASVGSQYFALAILDKSGVIPDAKTEFNGKSKVASTVLSYSRLNNTPDFKINYLGFAGPKSYNTLAGISEQLVPVIDFGWFSFIGKFLLKIMKAIHSVMGNWGVAIILLTLLVRLVVMPFNIMSYKSMKKMQVIQPQIKALREKFKEDKTKLNQEMMLLMKEAKANPLGGCLPMLIQIPILIALYQVIGQSIELYQAPFAFWIQDLSLKDPFYILPVLMGITMFAQQKITPNTLDPAQAKVMMFLPIMFTFVMATLPSGLTLYIFISTLFGVVQQLTFMKPAAATS